MDIDVGWIAIVLTVLSLGWEAWQVWCQKKSDKKIDKLEAIVTGGSSRTGIPTNIVNIIKKADWDPHNVWPTLSIDESIKSKVLGRYLGMTLTSGREFIHIPEHASDCKKFVKLIEAIRNEESIEGLVQKVEGINTDDIEVIKEHTIELKTLNSIVNGLNDRFNKFRDTCKTLESENQKLKDKLKELEDKPAPSIKDSIAGMLGELRDGSRANKVLSLFEKLKEEGPKEFTYNISSKNSIKYSLNNDRYGNGWYIDVDEDKYIVEGGLDRTVYTEDQVIHSIEFAAQKYRKTT